MENRVIPPEAEYDRKPQRPPQLEYEPESQQQYKQDAEYEKTVGIVGAGAAGLITGHTLLKDGFAVELLTRDDTPGGVWAGKRVYPGLRINNVHGELRFSAMPMPPPAAGQEAGRLSGDDMQRYTQAYAARLLEGRIRFGVEVEDIRADEHKVRGYVVTPGLGDGRAGKEEVVLCTAGCSEPSIPTKLSPHAAREMCFEGPVLHSQEFAERSEEVLAACETGRAVIIGGGKSAQDLAAFLARHDKQVTVVFESIDGRLSRVPVPSAGLDPPQPVAGDPVFLLASDHNAARALPAPNLARTKACLRVLELPDLVLLSRPGSAASLALAAVSQPVLEHQDERSGHGRGPRVVPRAGEQWHD